MIEHKYKIGDLLEEIVTGDTGIVLGITQYATGCLHYGILDRRLKAGGVPDDYHWYDETRLHLKKSGAVTFDNGKETKSGPYPNAPSL